MEINEETYVDSMYYIGDDRGNYLCTLFKQGDGPWQMEYRMRYFRDDDVWGSEDHKNFYSAKDKPGSEDLLNKVRHHMAPGGELRAGLEREYSGKLDVIELQCMGDDPKVLFELGSREWSNLKMGAEAERQLAKNKQEDIT